MRPNRASQSFGIGSLFRIVPVACARVMFTVFEASLHSRALLISTFTVSPPSFTESWRTRTKEISSVSPLSSHCVTAGRTPKSRSGVAVPVSSVSKS